MQPIQTQPLPQTAAPPPRIVLAPAPSAPLAYTHSVSEIVFSMLGKGLMYGTLGGAILGAIVGLPFLIIGALPGAFIGGALGLVQGFVNGLLLGLVSRLFFYPLTQPGLYRFILLLLAVPTGFFGTFYMFAGMWGAEIDGYSGVVSVTAAGYAIFASQRAANHYISLVGISPTVPRLRKPINPYDHLFLKQLFDTMQRSYETVSWICSFGFNQRWRRQLMARLDLREGMRVGDLMSGAGEMWPHIRQRIGTAGSITAVDFSPQMAATARTRLTKQSGNITVLEEDGLRSSIATGSLQALVCCYGVKTLAAHEQALFVQETSRVLQNHGLFGLVEISTPRHQLLRWPYLVYLRFVVPLVGRLFLADPLSYRMLAHYTEAFGNCRNLEQIFAANGFEVHYFELFGGCASGLIGMKVGTP